MSKKDEQIDNLITQYTNLQLSYVDYNQYMKARIENLFMLSLLLISFVDL